MKSWVTLGLSFCEPHAPVSEADTPRSALELIPTQIWRAEMQFQTRETCLLATFRTCASPLAWSCGAQLRRQDASDQRRTNIGRPRETVHVQSRNVHGSPILLYILYYNATVLTALPMRRRGLIISESPLFYAYQGRRNGPNSCPHHQTSPDRKIRQGARIASSLPRLGRPR